MKRKIIGFWMAKVMIIIGLFSCDKEEKPELLFEKPAHFPTPNYNFASNPLTKERVELGKALFYDGLLSRDGSISCGFCHGQEFAFTQHGHPLSHGIDNKLTKRNSQPIMNLAWQKDFMWDGGVHLLDLQPVAPIENANEMNETIGNVLNKLRKSDKYVALFQKAYGSNEITTDQFLKSLSQFMLTLVSSNSKYDKYVLGQSGGEFTQDEKDGLNLFKEKCSSCHSGELFTDLSFKNNGLPLINTEDLGRGAISLDKNDNYTFKIPSLRNAEVTRPYMHDGRFKKLEDVLNHYSEGMEDNPNLAPVFRQSNGKIGIPLTEDEKKKIIVFIKTLTDHDFLTNKRFSE